MAEITGLRGFARCVCLIATSVLVESWKYSAIFETIPKDADLDGLPCAWQRNAFNFWYADADGHGFYRVDNTKPNQVGSLTFATHNNGDSNFKMVDDPFQPTETSYKVELYIQSDKITMYVNDDVMYSSSRTMDVSDYRTAHFKSSNMICTSYQFIY